MKTGILLFTCAFLVIAPGCLSEPDNSGAAGAENPAANAAGAAGAHVPPPSENTDFACSDGVDNDNDGHTDCDDYDCSKNSEVSICGDESSVSACSDGTDNDYDNYVDCDDKDCCSVVSPCPASSYCGKQIPPGHEDSAATCSNGVDDDVDETTDCDDVGCCAVRQCPDGSGCNPGGICLDGIAEVTSEYPTSDPVTAAVSTAVLEDLGKFVLEVPGVDVEWKPLHSAPYTTTCMAIDNYAKPSDCHVTVRRQEWMTDSGCGTMQGTITIEFTDGSGLIATIVFASAVDMLEKDVWFGP